MKQNGIVPTRPFDEKDQDTDDVIIDSKQSEKSSSKNMNKRKEDCAHYTPPMWARKFFPSIPKVSVTLNFESVTPFFVVLYFIEF